MHITALRNLNPSVASLPPQNYVFEFFLNFSLTLVNISATKKLFSTEDTTAVSEDKILCQDTDRNNHLKFLELHPKLENRQTQPVTIKSRIQILVNGGVFHDKGELHIMVTVEEFTVVMWTYLILA